MFNKKSILFTIILAVGFSFQQCTNCDCGEYQAFFDIKGLSSMTHNSDRGIVNEGEEVTIAEYNSLIFHFAVDYHVIDDNSPSWGFSLMNTALACSCQSPGASGSKTEIIQKISVITMNDYNKNHKAGASINDIIQVKQFGSNELIDLDIFLANNTSEVKEIDFQLFLKSDTLDQDIDFQAKVIVELGTNETYETTSNTIRLKK